MLNGTTFNDNLSKLEYIKFDSFMVSFALLVVLKVTSEAATMPKNQPLSVFSFQFHSFSMKLRFFFVQTISQNWEYTHVETIEIPCKVIYNQNKMNTWKLLL